MMCPWKLLFKPGNSKDRSYDLHDMNNNLPFGPHTEQSLVPGMDAQWNGMNKKAGAMTHVLAQAKNPPNHIRTPAKASQCPKYLKLKNYENGTTFQDTLHHKAKETLGCKSKVCHGSIMNPKSLLRGPRDEPLPPDEVLSQAIEFMNQYNSSLKEPKIEEHLARLETVTKEIETTGTYQLTEAELIYATKQAWRNAPRCIGRIQWSNLQVFDARHITTAKEMFEHICRHLKHASNNGNVRSTITVFPQRTDGKHDFRVWNSQLVRYAGYQMPDGSTLGDPAGVEFTELCVGLGWRPKYGRFDVLPLVLQANGQDPEIFEIPPDLILEVSMEHPKYEWFKELDLRWYALPAVSNMLLEVGGIEFPACPFNGWYMGTEIGVRDFCDAQRLNVLEEVGRRMGLETHKLASLWKDRAVIEINVAVLHSFQKHNVTIMDHHSAAESFMKYMQNEHRLRGGCPADWVWLVPPMSGSITPVFHQEMLNYILTPFYYYQVEPWKTHVWQDEKRRPKKKEVKFSVLAKAVLFASALARKSMAARTKATILYATETGKSETFAKKLCTLFSCAFNTKVLCMDEYQVSDLEKETLLLVVTSTFGNGDSPHNGETFKKSLFTLKKLNNKFRYAVFGLGSTMYPQFCAFAHTVNQKLAQLGASQITQTGEGDELSGQEEAFLTWAVHTFKTACEAFNIRDRQNILLPKSYTSHETWDPEHHRLVNDTQPLDLSKELSNIHSRNIIPMKVKARQNLHSIKSSRATILLQLSCAKSQEVLRYLPGEHAGVFPGNQPELVSRLMRHLRDAPPSHQTVRLETLSDQGNYWMADKKIPPCSISQALTYFLDITTPPSQLLLKKLSLLATEERDRAALESLSHNLKEYNNWKQFNCPTIPEVLEEFPSVSVPTVFLLTQLPPLKARYYSISSSLDMVPGEIHLTVGVVNYRTKVGRYAQFWARRWETYQLHAVLDASTIPLPSLCCPAHSVPVRLVSLLLAACDITTIRNQSMGMLFAYGRNICSYNIVYIEGGQGPLHHGVCSTWLNTIALNGTVHCFVRSCSTFQLPENPSKPCLLIGPGTGISPYRSFWQQRLWDLEKKGVKAQGMVLVFGCHQSGVDHIYKDEAEKMRSKSVLKSIHTAYSREPGKPKTYVQDILRSELEVEVCRIVHEEDGHLYICGDVRMARDVGRTLKDIIAQKLKLTEEQVEEYFSKLKSQMRYHEDIFGAAFKAEEKNPR